MSSLVRLVGAALAALLCVVAPLAAAQDGAGETALYLMVLHPGGGAEPDVALLGGKLLKSRMNRRLVELPATAVGQLERHPRVAYLQRVWDGKESAEPLPLPVPLPQSAPMRVAPESESTIAWESQYTYDGSGNIATAGSATGGTESYTYDLVGRLSTATVKGVTESYAYDSFGNLVRTTGGVAGPSISTSTNQIAGRTYDAIGNQLTVRKGAVNATADYDALGMIVELPTVTGSRRMIYTADDERIAVVVSNGIAADERTEIRVRDLRGKVLTEWHKTPEGVEWIRDYVYAEGRLVGGARQVRSDDPAPTRHYHLDHLGSIRRITRTDGVSVSEIDYLPFGTELTPATTEATRPGGYTPLDPAKFTGHERDYLGLTNEPGGGDVLDYMHARYYDGGVGRFLSVDPKYDDDVQFRPQKWNRYSYAANNPIRYIDPDGRGIYDFIEGAANGWSSSNLGNINRVNPRNLDYKRGQMVGDAVAAIQGFYEMAVGGQAAIGGGGATLLTAGAASPVSVPVAAGGVIVATHGGVVAATALNNLASANRGSSSSSGDTPNEVTPSTNKDAFTGMRGRDAKVNKETGEVWVRDRLHKDHWEVYKNQKEYEKGNRVRSVWDDGRLKETY